MLLLQQVGQGEQWSHCTLLSQKTQNLNPGPHPLSSTTNLNPQTPKDRLMNVEAEALNLHIGSIVVPFSGLYLEPHKVFQKRNYLGYLGGYGYIHNPFCST